MARPNVLRRPGWLALALGLLAGAAGLLLALVLSAGYRDRPEYHTLLTADCFYLPSYDAKADRGRVTPSAEVAAFRALLAHPRADRAFGELLRTATLEGQLYALCGLWFADHDLFRRAVREYRRMPAEVHERIVGCGMSGRVEVRARVASSSPAALIEGLRDFESWVSVSADETSEDPDALLPSPELELELAEFYGGRWWSVEADVRRSVLHLYRAHGRLVADLGRRIQRGGSLATRVSLIEVAGALGPDGWPLVDLLRILAHDRLQPVRFAAAQALWNVDHEMGPLYDVLSEEPDPETGTFPPDPWPRFDGGGPGAVRALASVLSDDRDPQKLEWVLLELAERGPDAEEALPAVRRAARHGAESVRRAAELAIARIEER